MTNSLQSIQPVLLAGGKGRRLWPLSRSSKPKPFLKLGGGGQTLLQQTVGRCESYRAPLVVAGYAARPHATIQLQGTRAELMFEPEGRGTAAALGAAAHYLSHKEDMVLLVMPSDHVITKPDILHQEIIHGLPYAEDGKFVCLGAKPNKARTDYGYIVGDAEIQRRGLKISHFHEKPDKAQAKSYVSTSLAFWNTGIFMVRASVYLAALHQCAGQIHEQSRLAVRFAGRQKNAIVLNADHFGKAPYDAVDHAVLEHLGADIEGIVMPVDMGWKDIGSWKALLW